MGLMQLIDQDLDDLREQGCTVTDIRLSQSARQALSSEVMAAFPAVEADPPPDGTLIEWYRGVPVVVADGMEDFAVSYGLDLS